MQSKILLTMLFSIWANLGFAQNIEKTLIDNEKTLVHIHASWCPTCKIQTKNLKKINLDGIKVLEVDFDKDKSFIKKHNINQQSLFLSFYKGKEISRRLGLISKDKIENFVSQSFSDKNLQLRINKKLSNSKVPTSIRQKMNDATKKTRSLRHFKES